jgi:tetratricopeptide (TPR) repeat protein
MRKTLLIAAGMGMLLANVAFAQRSRGPTGRSGGGQDDEGLQVGDYAPSIEAEEWLNVEHDEDIPSLIELRGMVVVVFFWVSWHEGGEYLLPMVNMLSYNPRIGRTGGVYTIGVTDADRKVTQPLIEDAKIFFPVAVGSKSADEYGFTGGFGFVVIDPEGKIAFKGGGRGDVGGAANAIVELFNEMPPTKTHPEEAQVCYRKLDEARDLIRDEKYTRARKLAREAFERSVLGDRLQSRALEVADLIEQLGYERLAEFDPLMAQRKYDAAAQVLRDVIRLFRKLDCYRDAKALYETLRKEDESFEEAAARFDNEDAATRLYLEARDDVKARRFGVCYDKLNKIMTEYSRTQAAEYAEAMLDRMKRNKDVWALIVDHQAAAVCRELLARARNLKAQGRYEQAEVILRRIMTEHPNTLWAEEAVKELKDMPRRD